MIFALKKSQIVVEFMLLAGIALIATIIFVVSISQNKNLYDTKEFFLIKDVALKIQNEISITSFVDDGYSRQFELPKKINDKNYNISIRNNTLTVWNNSTSYLVAILNITGYLKKESNNITKSNGMTYIN